MKEKHTLSCLGHLFIRVKRLMLFCFLLRRSVSLLSAFPLLTQLERLHGYMIARHMCLRLLQK